MFVISQDLRAAARFTLQPNLVPGGPQVGRERDWQGLVTEADFPRDRGTSAA